MPQLSPINWAAFSIIILSMVFMTKMFFSFLSSNKLQYLTSAPLNLSNLGPSKWNW